MNRFFIALWCFCGSIFADTIPDRSPASISSNDLPEFSHYSPQVQKTIRYLLDLTAMNLSYQYGSADPKAGGMDCSGTIFYVLQNMGIKDIPRSSDLQYQWVANQGHLYSVSSTTSTLSSKEFAYLQPGDLLFWTHTYNIQRDNSVTHVMMYLGKNKDGQPLMAGASNGRTYQGRKIYGVSVFDFKVPDTDGHFVGYGCVPNLNCTKPELK
jgi:hypothetical protein